KISKVAPLVVLALAAAGCGGHGASPAARGALDAGGQVQTGGSTSVRTGVSATAEGGVGGSGQSGSLGGGVRQSQAHPGNSPAPGGATPSPTGPAAHREI